MAATSWNSRIANAMRPCGEPSCLRSVRICKPSAVDDNASASPTISAGFQSNPATTAAPPISPADTTTCSEPAPNTALRISHRRCGLNSVPMMNSNRITPNSENSDHCFVSGVRLSTCGPISAPAAR